MKALQKSEVVLSRLSYKCSRCKREYTRNVSWIDPARFSPDKQEHLSTFALLCPFESCSLPTVLVLRHLPDRKVEVKEVAPSTTVYGWPRTQ